MGRSTRFLIIVGSLSVWMFGPGPLAWAQTVCQEGRVTAFDGGLFQSFGDSVAVSGETAVIGAQGDNDNGTQSGSAYVYRREPGPEGRWVFAQKLLASDGTTNNRFGSAVTIDGDVIVVGAFGHFHDDDSGLGSAYVFRFDSDTSMWIEEQELLPSDGELGDRFGFAVAVSGNIVVIGADGDDDNGGQSGSAYIFRYDPDTSRWIEEQKLLASDGAAGDFFGNAVAILADPAGDVAVIGAGGHDELGHNSGAAYVYRFDPKTPTWVEQQELLASDGAASDNFALDGVSLSGIEGEAVVIGARGEGINIGAAYVFRFDADTSSWFEEQKLVGSGGSPGQFGRAVAMDGNVVLIGSWKADAVGNNYGAAYVFRYDADSSQWSQADMLVPDPGPWASWFGWSVALDGDQAVCGAHGEDQQRGAAYVFDVALNCNCPHDLDLDGSVGASDLLALLASWGPCKGCPADFDGNGTVGASDLLALLANWGPCP